MSEKKIIRSTHPAIAIKSPLFYIPKAYERENRHDLHSFYKSIQKTLKEFQKKINTIESKLARHSDHVPMLKLVQRCQEVLGKYEKQLEPYIQRLESHSNLKDQQSLNGDNTNALYESISSVTALYDELKLRSEIYQDARLNTALQLDNIKFYMDLCSKSLKRGEDWRWPDSLKNHETYAMVTKYAGTYTYSWHSIRSLDIETKFSNEDYVTAKDIYNNPRLAPIHITIYTSKSTGKLNIPHILLSVDLDQLPNIVTSKNRYDFEIIKPEHLGKLYEYGQEAYTLSYDGLAEKKTISELFNIEEDYMPEMYFFIEVKYIDAAMPKNNNLFTITYEIPEVFEYYHKPHMLDSQIDDDLTEMRTTFRQSFEASKQFLSDLRQKCKAEPFIQKKIMNLQLTMEKDYGRLCGLLQEIPFEREESYSAYWRRHMQKHTDFFEYFPDRQAHYVEAMREIKTIIQKLQASDMNASDTVFQNIDIESMENRANEMASLSPDFDLMATAKKEFKNTASYFQLRWEQKPVYRNDQRFTFEEKGMDIQNIKVIPEDDMFINPRHASTILHVQTTRKKGVMNLEVLESLFTKHGKLVDKLQYKQEYYDQNPITICYDGHRLWDKKVLIASYRNDELKERHRDEDVTTLSFDFTSLKKPKSIGYLLLNRNYRKTPKDQYIYVKLSHKTYIPFEEIIAAPHLLQNPIR